MNAVKKTQGFVLVLVLMCTLILTVMMMSTMFISSKGQKLSKNFKESVQTLNAADAAVKQAKAAINTWLVSQQVPPFGSGSEVNFTPILTASDAVGHLSIPGDSTDWSNLDLLGNSISIDVSDIEGGSEVTTDTDRIINLNVIATGPARQRVNISVTIQAPSVENSHIPTFQGGISMCGDGTDRPTNIVMEDGSMLSGYNYLETATLPDFSCTGASCLVNDVNVASSYNHAPLMVQDESVQTLDAGPSATLTGVPATVQTFSDATNCEQIIQYANQLSSLSSDLKNVNIVTGSTLTSSDLGTRDNPKVVIVSGKGDVSIEPNTHGSGILLIQSPLLAIGAGFYFEGLVIVYGNEESKLQLIGSDMLYGAVAIISAGAEKLKMMSESKMVYSRRALQQAALAVGTNIDVSPLPISTSNDTRNSTLTVGWFEQYN